MPAGAGISYGLGLAWLVVVVVDGFVLVANAAAKDFLTGSRGYT